jgi:superfamily II DNA or RNA helicase
VCNTNTISLLPHNQKLFDEIMELINNGEHSIFYSEAMGLGKSYIFMKLVEKLFKNKKVLYIAPTIAIWNNINNYKEFELIKPYVNMLTYASFNSIKSYHYDYDVMFIDESHHLASEIQGVNILKVCDKYLDENKYIFGLTATPETGLAKIDTAEYFDRQVYGMNTIDAIKNGLFNKIEYAVTDDHTKINDKLWRRGVPALRYDAVTILLNYLICMEMQ